MKPTVIIGGSNGQLGSEIRELTYLNDHYQWELLDSQAWDVSNIDSTRQMLSSYSPQIVINCAAYTAVDLAESEPEICYRVNSEALKNLAIESQSYGTHIIQISTDFVFDGQKSTPYIETDPTAPLSIYGSSKLAGEENLKNHTEKYSIFRTSWLYSQYGHNFVKTMLRLAETRTNLNVVADQIGTPTHARDLAKFLVQNLSEIVKRPGEIYHYSNEGVASWYDLAHQVFELSGITIDLNPIGTKDYPTAAKRPHYSVMSKAKIRNTYGVKIPHWRDSLKQCIESMSK